MKRFTEWMRGAALLGALALVLAGCPTGNENDKDTGDDGVDWMNYQTAGSFSIRIKNEANRDLVVFKNTVITANMLGGVPKNASDHGLKLTSTHFNQNNDFSLIFITKEEYVANKGNDTTLALLGQQPFTRIFAVYNASGTNEVPWIVSGKLGGNSKLVINNMTSFNMELRQDSPRGTTLGYAPYESNNTTLFMNTGSVDIFPVFKKYNALRDEILTIYPRTEVGLPVSDSFSFTGSNAVTINAQNFTSNTNFSSGAAFLVIKNSSNRGIRVMKGVEVLETITGIQTINSGDERTFIILMGALGQGQFEDSTEFSGWKVMYSGGLERDLSSTTLEADYRYTVTIGGSWDNNTATVSDYVKGSGKITAEVMAGGL